MTEMEKELSEAKLEIERLTRVIRGKDAQYEVKVNENRELSGYQAGVREMMRAIQGLKSQ